MATKKAAKKSAKKTAKKGVGRKHIAVYVTDSEYAEIAGNAHDAGRLPIGTHVRLVYFGKVVK